VTAVCCNGSFACQAENVDLVERTRSAPTLALFLHTQPTLTSLSHRKGGNYGDDAILDLKQGDKVIARCL
jgi:hypothetical protein